MPLEVIYRRKDQVHGLLFDGFDDGKFFLSKNCLERVKEQRVGWSLS